MSEASSASTTHVKQLSDGNPDGTVLGQNAADLISFHNATPVAQRSGATQAAVTQIATDAAYTTAGGGGTPTAALEYTYLALLHADVKAMNVLLTEVRAMLVAKGLMKGSA